TWGPAGPWPWAPRAPRRTPPARASVACGPSSVQVDKAFQRFEAGAQVQHIVISARGRIARQQGIGRTAVPHGAHVFVSVGLVPSAPPSVEADDGIVRITFDARNGEVVVDAVAVGAEGLGHEHVIRERAWADTLHRLRVTMVGIIG